MWPDLAAITLVAAIWFSFLALAMEF